MHQSELERILRGETQGDRRWPPGKAERERWQTVAEFRRRYENDAAELFRWRTDLHVAAGGYESAPSTHERQKVFTPVPLARDLAKFSASLLFSEPPKIRLPEEASSEQERLDEWLEQNRVAELLLDAGDTVASEGSAALRVVWDDHVSSEVPLITFHAEDSVLWSTRHGRYTLGGVLAISVEEENNTAVVWRLLEAHLPGKIERVLYKGGADRLGKRHELTEGPPQFRDLRLESRTGVDRPTLIRWENVPGGHSDLAGLEPLLDALDEAASVGRVKMRASQPVTYLRRFSARDLDSLGALPMHNMIAIDDWPGRYLGSDRPGVPVESPFPVENLIVTSQPGLEASEHREYVEHVRELAIATAGYSLASWGLDREGRADSGTALKLRQVRTLLTRAGKERMARQAIAEACGVALGMMLGRAQVDTLMPDVELSDGMPRDGLQDAEELLRLRNANAISTEEIVRRLHPEWPEEKILEEVGRIAGAAPAAEEAPQLRSIEGGS
jgi:hypothetical protein